MIELVLKVLGAGLELWASKEKTKYQDRFIELKKALHEEMKKPYEERNHAAIDDIFFNIELLCHGFATASSVSTKDFVSKP